MKKKTIVVLPAFNAARTIEKTYGEIPFHVVDEVILVDDASSDETANVARKLGIHHVEIHEHNRGYGANQKTCYRLALERNADIVVMLHPDYQYTPRLIEAMVSLIANEVFPVVMGSRILGNGAIRGGMPIYKYLANRVLTFIQNLASGQKLSEYHTGYRAFSRDVLEAINFDRNSDGFLFDNQMLAQIIAKGYQIGEITCPTHYSNDSSSISFKHSLGYGIGVLYVSFRHLLHRMGWSWTLLK